MVLELDADRVLRPVRQDDLDELFAVVVANRDHLAPWLPWAAQPTHAAIAGFVESALAQEARDDGFHGVILEHGRIVGVAGYHHVNRRDLATSLGYWLAADAEGQGTMTLAVKALVDHAFGPWGLHRVELRAAIDNARSRAVAERLGFVQEGVLRDAERFDDRYVDLAVYSVLAPEWRVST